MSNGNSKCYFQNIGKYFSRKLFDRKKGFCKAKIFDFILIKNCLKVTKEKKNEYSIIYYMLPFS